MSYSFSVICNILSFVFRDLKCLLFVFRDLKYTLGYIVNKSSLIFSYFVRCMAITSETPQEAQHISLSKLVSVSSPTTVDVEFHSPPSFVLLSPFPFPFKCTTAIPNLNYKVFHKQSIFFSTISSPLVHFLLPIIFFRNTDAVYTYVAVSDRTFFFQLLS